MSVVSRRSLCRVWTALLLVLWFGLPSLARADLTLVRTVSDAVEALELPVPRTFGLAHVEPEHFAAALGNDPDRIFAFVRDQVSYEVYEGYLRGPRGTLLAMAGNSVDQAALLGSLLQHAGQRVRYVHGELSESDAERLVDVLWSGQLPGRPEESDAEMPDEVDSLLDSLASGVERDAELLAAHLSDLNVDSADPGPDRSALVREARTHYWVQLWRDGAWIDLDPSFAGLEAGSTVTDAGRVVDRLPQELAHRIEMRVRLEEYTDPGWTTRTILKRQFDAADLSGIALSLVHLPENWRGPVDGLDNAITTAIEDTGRIKPVLIVGDDEWPAGEPFRLDPPTQQGLGGAMNMLSGAGIRNPVPIATAEWVEFDFVYPDGRRETVVREIFDHVGMARRAAPGIVMTVEDVRALVDGGRDIDVATALFEISVTTGRIDSRHFHGIGDTPNAPDGDAGDLRQIATTVATSFAAVSDAALHRIDVGGTLRAVTYFDTPRVVIVSFTAVEDRLELSLDLRRDRARVLARDGRPGNAFATRVLRGVFDGTLERVLVEQVAGSAQGASGGGVFSTSALLEQARAEGRQIARHTLGGDVLDPSLPADTQARLRAELANGSVIIAPETPVTVAGEPRFAWWRVDPRSGETIAVTDDGLHEATTEYVVIHNQDEGHVTIIWREFVRGRWRRTDLGTFQYRSQQLGAYIRQILAESARPDTIYRELVQRGGILYGGF